jgi:hypothetical protein
MHTYVMVEKALKSIYNILIQLTIKNGTSPLIKQINIRLQILTLL